MEKALERVLSSPKKPKLPPWVEAKVRVLGAENYELGGTSAKIRFINRPGGFITQFLEPLAIPAEQLMGPYIKMAYITDVIVDTGILKLSMASLNKGEYPRVLREGDILNIVTK